VDDPYAQPVKLEETAVGSESVPKRDLFVMGDYRRYSKTIVIIGADCSLKI
jgi:hypothetical protein